MYKAKLYVILQVKTKTGWYSNMLYKAHYERMLSKLKRLENTLNPYLFSKVESLSVKAFLSDKQLHSIPNDEYFEKISSGWKWGAEGQYCWLKSEYIVPPELNGKDLFLMPKLGGYEAMLWVNGVPFGTYNNKITYTAHGNHYCGLIKKNAKADEKIELAVEYYEGHVSYTHKTLPTKLQLEISVVAV